MNEEKTIFLLQRFGAEIDSLPYFYDSPTKVQFRLGISDDFRVIFDKESLLSD